MIQCLHLRSCKQVFRINEYNKSFKAVTFIHEQSQSAHASYLNILTVPSSLLQC